jgi:anti-sigma B factor antagonist
MFAIRSRSCDPATWVISIEGSVDLSNVPEVQEAIQHLFDQRIYRIILDIERVSFISSAGFGVFLHARETVLRHGGDLVFAGTNSRVREIFDLLGITSFLRFAPDVGGARAQLEQGSAANDPQRSSSSTLQQQLDEA